MDFANFCEFLGINPKSMWDMALCASENSTDLRLAREKYHLLDEKPNKIICDGRKNVAFAFILGIQEVPTAS